MAHLQSRLHVRPSTDIFQWQYLLSLLSRKCSSNLSKLTSTAPPTMLTVTAQQSRFHNETIEGSALKEVGFNNATYLRCTD